MFKRFVFASLAFAGIIVPGAFTLALVAAPPVRPATAQLPGCERSLAEAEKGLAGVEARVKSLDGTTGQEMRRARQLYFLEVLKARAVSALCNNGTDSRISLVSREE
ncbi:MAG TPA: hypothetical protein VLU23_00050 [Pseudolabrys sp.]|jgi:hypothetical protein|nr:hypothetical protein [Pseudolabrys sp.]